MRDGVEVEIVSRNGEAVINDTTASEEETDTEESVIEDGAEENEDNSDVTEEVAESTDNTDVTEEAE